MKRKSLETFVYSAGGVVAMGIILIGFCFLTSAFWKRVDLTKEKAYTLSDGTKTILRNLDSTVKIRFYCSQNEISTPDVVFLKKYARDVEDLLAEYKQAARGKI